MLFTTPSKLLSAIQDPNPIKAQAGYQAAQAYLLHLERRRTAWTGPVRWLTRVLALGVITLLAGLFFLPPSITEAPPFAPAFLAVCLTGLAAESLLASLTNDTPEVRRLRQELEPVADSDAAVVALGTYVSESASALEFAKRSVHEGHTLRIADLGRLQRLHAQDLANRRPSKPDVIRHNLRELLR